MPVPGDPWATSCPLASWLARRLLSRYHVFVAAVYTYPVLLLLTTYFFTPLPHTLQLFALLTVDAEIGRAVWDLLQLLPTNTAKLRALRKLDAGASRTWDALLDPRSAYSLLYSLQIVDSFLQQPEAPPSGLRTPAGARPHALKAEWVSRFLQGGGLAQLQRLIKRFTCRAPGSFDVNSPLPMDTSARLSVVAYVYFFVFLCVVVRMCLCVCVLGRGRGNEVFLHRAQPHRLTDVRHVQIPV